MLQCVLAEDEHHALEETIYNLLDISDLFDVLSDVTEIF